MRLDATQPPFWTGNRVIPVASMLMVLALCLLSSLGPVPTLTLSLIACWRVCKSSGVGDRYPTGQLASV